LVIVKRVIGIKIIPEGRDRVCYTLTLDGSEQFGVLIVAVEAKSLPVKIVRVEYRSFNRIEAAVIYRASSALLLPGVAPVAGPDEVRQVVITAIHARFDMP
jgi:hypothetical protein